MATAALELRGCCEPQSKLGKAWTRMVSSNLASGFMQSLPWAQFKRAQGLQTTQVLIHEREELAGGAIFYAAKSSRGSSILACPDGPVLDWSDRNKASAHLQLIVDAAQQLATEYGAIALRIEPRLPETDSRLRHLARARADLNPIETLLLDLRGGESALLSGMKAKCRYNIRLAERHGVRVREVSYSPQATDTFYSVLREASIRNGFVCEPAHFFDKLFRNLAEHKMATMLLAEHDGAVLACLLMVVCGERATYLYGGSRNEKRNLMAGYALQWQAIRVAIASGCKIYDFYGFDRFSNPSNPYAKFSRFKRQFGGFPVRYTGAHDHFFIDQLADSVVRALREVGASILNVER